MSGRILTGIFGSMWARPGEANRNLTMSYTLFVIIFFGLPLAGLIFLLRGRLYRGFLIRIGAVAAIGLAYFTLWGNYFVASRIWFHEPAMTLGFPIGYLPVEEYVMFALQAAGIGLLMLWLWYIFYPGDFG
jgi:lycopene cyclase domain-containing protein